jgi:hypothetical protein
VGGFPQVYLLIHLGQLVLGEEGLAVLCLLGILLLGVLHHLGILLQGVLRRLEILLVVLPWVVLPIQTEFLVVRSFVLVYLGGLLGLVLLLGIGLRHLR